MCELTAGLLVSVKHLSDTAVKTGNKWKPTTVEWRTLCMPSVHTYASLDSSGSYTGGTHTPERHGVVSSTRYSCMLISPLLAWTGLFLRPRVVA